MVASVLGLTLLSVKDTTWKLKGKLRFEVSDGKIIQSSDDTEAIEIPLKNIESLHEYRGWLLIRGCGTRTANIDTEGNRRISRR